MLYYIFQEQFLKVHQITVIFPPGTFKLQTIMQMF